MNNIQFKDLEIKSVRIDDENYPKLLRQINDPPKILYYLGNLDCLNSKTIAVVGTRNESSLGKLNCEKFVRTLVQYSLTIVSGLALGIDTTAHKTAIENEGKTVAVLGSGLNNIYPTQNIELAQNIIDSGGAVVSEFPPDYPVLPENFPARNRIISGLSQATLVVEAGSRSGSQITARLALEQGRNVFVIDQAELIQDGAKVVFEPEEILEELGINNRLQVTGNRVQYEAKLSEIEKKVLLILEKDSLHIDEIGRTLNMSKDKILGLLLKMEISGLIINLGNKTYCKL